ncbi:MAG: methylmalonyl Co-A mutase-associated GTPase MeaB [Verrucomicrobiales bacterium]|nr:methylmalonyl Co-A mutase-associated GTPase MeaB [Verrucomicrobiales bacterium]
METADQTQSSKGAVARRGGLSVDDYVAGVKAGDRAMLGRAITLIESTSARHEAKAQEMLQQLLPSTGGSRRVGITGVPGVGKSTFIEALGLHLCGQGHRVAVLAIDPTSTLSRGSILGDKTRMERLSGEARAFIRPSPSGGSLGGVARRTRETLLVCEAAGFDVVLVETVGVGQSEVALRSMVDFFLLLLLPGAGDDLQGIKRGIMEMADAVLVNKADGENRRRAEAARSEQAMALHTMAPATPGWQVSVLVGSGLTGEGIADLWQTVERFYAQLGVKGGIASRRAEQLRQWLDDLVREELQRRLDRHQGVRMLRPELERGVAAGEITTVRAARMLLEAFDKLPAGGRPTEDAAGGLGDPT